MSKKYDIAAYVWPSYTGDEPRSKMFWEEGMGEWQSVKSATKKFPEHDWPRKPLWGYVNEADPYVMEMQIQAAIDHGVNVFIYDWYWYDGRPFLEQCLNDGFLKAKNNKSMKFYLMWANHNANHLWNKKLSDTNGSTVIWQGGVNLDEFKKIATRVVNNYFICDNYYQINGCPVFMIYEPFTFINGLGGVENAKLAIQFMREIVKSAGFKDLHLQFCLTNRVSKSLDGLDSPKGILTNDLIKNLQVDSLTHYQFVHYMSTNGLLKNYNEAVEETLEQWERIVHGYEIPYFCHISCGWDNNPRFTSLRPPVMVENTPKNFEKALYHAKKYVDDHKDQPPLITINSWNEWTETSYLQPDDLYGYGYLQAIKKVFM